MQSNSPISVKNPLQHYAMKPQSHGCGHKSEYRVTFDEHRNAKYRKVGEINIREYVGSFANGCSLKSLLDRCQFMPTDQVVSSLVQNPGVSADLVGLPKDLTQACIMAQDLRDNHPDIVSRLGAGESINDIISSLMPAPAKENTTESEVIENGEN